MRPAPAALAAALVVVAGAAAAQAPPIAPELKAVRLAVPPRLDGAVADDPAWQGVPFGDTFWQTTPVDGAPASERTEVRVGYTHEVLYVAVSCFDREPGRIIVAESRRDASLDETDSVRLVLDTYLDHQNGFVFGTNPAGIEYDGQVTGEGEEAAGGDFNLDWDASWQVRARADEQGWSAEFAIPFRTLRYARGGVQSWGLNVQRNIRRRNETAYWAPLPRQFGLHRVSRAGLLREVDVPGQRNLKATPYLLGQSREQPAAADRRQLDGEAGLDLKYSLTPSLTLDATVNTDFAHVEADEQQINLDRFSLFFPEKRPFFLENAALFTEGTPGEVDLFFSRRIGIGPEGQVIPILAGGRLSGKLAGTSVGVLNMQTRAVEGVTPANNFTVMRVSRELPHRSVVGAIFVNREATGSASRSGDHNRAFGLDGRWGFGRFGTLSGYLSGTRTPGITRDDHALSLTSAWSSPAWALSAGYTEVGEGFRPEVGFLRRQGYRKPDLLVLHRRRMGSFLGLHEIRPHVSYRGFWKPDGFHESGFLHMDSHWEWKSGHEVHTGVNLTREGLRAPFEIVPGVIVPPGGYDHREAQIVAFTNKGAPVSFESRFTFGGFLGGRRRSYAPSLSMRRGEALQARLEWSRNAVELPGGRFATNLLRLRSSWSWGPRAYVQALVQYNDRTDLWSANLRFGWLQTANAGLFVVYNETRETAGLDTGLRDRSLVVKFSRLVDLLD